jgi:protein-S-isoprenylcysteine O-methyltransferase Ste14
VKGLRGKIPLGMSGALFLFVLVAGTLRVSHGLGARVALPAAAVLVYMAWLVVESLLVSVREASLPDASGDRGSLELYALAQGATVVLTLTLAGTVTSAAVGAIGLALLVAGCGFRLGAVVTLGRLYTRRVRLLEGHRVVTTGPYRVVRHPAYLGTLAGHLGFALVFAHWIPLAVWAGLFVPMVVRRILVEEPVLFELAGYREYAQGRKRLVPWVW